MRRRTRAVALAGIAGLCALALAPLLWTAGAGRDARAETALARRAMPAPPVAATSAEGGASEHAVSDRTDVAPGAARARDTGVSHVDAADAGAVGARESLVREIRGRIAVPAGASLGPKSAVIALFYGIDEIERAELDDARGFTVPVPAGAIRCVLDLDSSSVYLPRAHVLGSLDSPPPELLLEAVPYGRIQVTLTGVAEVEPCTVYVEGTGETGALAAPRWRIPGAPLAHEKLHRASARTSDGRCTFEDLRADRTYRVTCQPLGHVPMQQSGVVVEPGRTTLVELESPGNRVHGRVLAADGEPIRGASVMVRVRGPDVDRTRGGGLTSEQGAYSLRGVGAGELTLLVQVPVMDALPSGTSGERASFDVVESAGWLGSSEDRELDVHVPALAPVTVKMRCSRDPAPERVHFVASTAEGATDGWGGLHVRSTVEPSAVLELLAPMNVPIEMLASDEQGGAAAWSGVLTGATTIKLDLASAVVRGLVVDDTGTPMRSFQLTGAILSPLGSCQSAFRRSVVADDGRFEIAIPRGGGATFGARCVLADGTIASTDGDVIAADGESEVLVRVQAHASVAGVVLDPAGAPLRGAEVEVQWARPAESDRRGGPVRGCVTGVTGDDGRFVVKGVPPGPARILVRSRPDTERALTLAPREHREGVVLEL